MKANSQGQGTAGAQHGMCEMDLTFTVLKSHIIWCLFAVRTSIWARVGSLKRI